MSKIDLHLIQDIYDELKLGTVIPLYESIIEQYNRDIMELMNLSSKYPDIKRFQVLYEKYQYKAELLYELLNEEKQLVLKQAKIEADQYG